jgi:spectrin beta, non-erythrocytic 1/4/5
VESQMAAAQSVFDEAASLGVTENVYTPHNPASLAGVAEELRGALSKRQEAYAQELAKQQANDALCKEFAEMAEPLAAFIKEHKDKITHSKEELEAQLSFVEECIGSVPTDKLAAAKAQQEKIDAAGITNNRHTLLSAKDLEVQFGQYNEFLSQKKTMLEEAIEHHKLRGITPEQYREIEENFKAYDKSGSGSLNAKELKACLYSLGEERGRAEIQAIIQQHGGDGADELDYNGFKEFMITLLGDTDTQDEIVDSFKLINRGDVATDARMEIVGMPEHDQEYIRKTAPAVEGGYDFNVWTADVFSR